MEKIPRDRPWPLVCEFRFVVLLRGEPRDRAGTQAQWRGWITRVPDATELASGFEPQPIAFGTIDELPGIIRSVMQGADGKRHILDE